MNVSQKRIQRRIDFSKRYSILNVCIEGPLFFDARVEIEIVSMDQKKFFVSSGVLRNVRSRIVAGNIDISVIIGKLGWVYYIV